MAEQIARKVLILGINGNFGGACAQAFLRSGWQVMACQRDASTPCPAGVLALPHALGNAQLAPAAAGAAVVVYGVNVPYSEWHTQAEPLLAQGLALAKALDARLVFPGNVYNYGQPLPARLHEGLPQQAATRKGQVRVRMEAQLRQAGQQGQRSLVVRAGDFFGGSANTSWFNQVVVKHLVKGKLSYPGPLDVAHAWAYLPDLARTVVALCEHEAQLQGFESVHFAGHTLTGRELLKGIEQACASRLKWGSLPWGLMRLGSPFVPMVRELLEMRYLWQQAHTLDDARLQALLTGAVPHTPLPQALAGAVGTQRMG